MKFKPLPAGFVIPTQPVKGSEPPSGADWVHEIKHDGYHIIVRRDGPTVRLYSRNGNNWTMRLAAIAAAADQIKAKSFSIDGEAVVLGPDGLSRFEELSHREGARAAILYAFDLIEHDGEDMRNLPFLDRKAALAQLLRNTEAGFLFNEHIVEDGAVVFAHACRLGAEGCDGGPRRRLRSRDHVLRSRLVQQPGLRRITAGQLTAARIGEVRTGAALRDRLCRWPGTDS